MQVVEQTSAPHNSAHHKSSTMHAKPAQAASTQDNTVVGNLWRMGGSSKGPMGHPTFCLKDTQPTANNCCACVLSLTMLQLAEHMT
jgi:hypothetical protein